MRALKPLCLGMALLLASTCFAGGSESHGTQEHIAIHTYGGGLLLEKVFNALAMLLYGNAKTGLDKSFTAIIRLSLLVGGFCALCLAFFREKFEPLIKTFFLPGLVIVGFLLIPRTTITIKDHLTQKTASTAVWGTKKIDNIPFFLGKLTMLVSEVSFRLQCLLTGSVHGVNDTMYNWTGNIYAAENIFQAKRCKISNPTIEDNFREFSRECVFRDIGLGLYNKNDLIKTPNILQFLEEHTTNIRTVFYKDPLESNTHSTCLTCKEAIKQINSLLNGKQVNAKELLLGELGNQMHFLLGQKKAGEKDLENLIKQQIAIDILKEEVPGTTQTFAAKRAEILQKENQKILGALGASSIVAMKDYFEATIYMIFPLTLIVALLSFGIQAIIIWVQSVVWINTWPVFYIVVNFMLNSIWDIRKQVIFGGETSGYLTVFSSEGLCNLYSSMESIAAIALAFIPFLSWILLKGGVSQMVHLASSLTSPAQAAASTAASEKTTGNYNFGNISLDSLSGYNAQMFKQSYSGTLSQGSVGIDSGSQTMTYVPSQDELYLKQSDSYLREGISHTEAFNYSMQNSLSSSQTALKESSHAVSSSLTNSANKGVSFVDAISRHMQTGESMNSQDMTSAQESFQFIRNATEEYASTKGVSRDAAIRELLSGGISSGLVGQALGIKGDAQMSAQDGVSEHSSDSGGDRASESSGFQYHLQKIKNFSTGEVASVLGSEDVKLHQDFVQSLNETESSLDQWRAAYSTQESLSTLKSHVASDNVSIHQNLNQRFVDFLKDKYHGDTGEIINATELNNTSPEKRALIDEFVQTYLPSTISTKEISPPQEVKSAYSGEVSEAKFEKDKTTFINEKKARIGQDFGEVEMEISHRKSRNDVQMESMKQDLHSQGEDVEGLHKKTKENINLDKSLTTRAWEELASAKALKIGAENVGKGIYHLLYQIGENQLEEK